MEEIDILEELENKENKPEDYVEHVMNNLKLIPTIIGGMQSSRARVRFGSAKMLRIISEKDPQLLYPHMNFFIDLLESENNILRWITIDVIGNLSNVDTKKKFDEIFNRYYALLSNEGMVTVAHIVDNSGKIALAKPYLRDEITKNLLELENISRNEECKNILLGKAILSFGMYYDQVDNKDEIISFVKRQLTNPRNSTKKKAEKFLKRFNPDN